MKLCETISLASGVENGKNELNKTPQAYPAACCRDAQTGGFLFFVAKG